MSLDSRFYQSTRTYVTDALTKLNKATENILHGGTIATIDAYVGLIDTIGKSMQQSSENLAQRLYQAISVLETKDLSPSSSASNTTELPIAIEKQEQKSIILYSAALKIIEEADNAHDRKVTLGARARRLRSWYERKEVYAELKGKKIRRVDEEQLRKALDAFYQDLSSVNDKKGLAYVNPA